MKRTSPRKNISGCPNSYPAASVSLRTASPENIVLQTTETSDSAPQIIGEVDLASAYWMVHPRAIYIHEGQQYFVHELNLERNIATLTAVALDYYTEPQSETEIQILSESERSEIKGGEKGWGEIQVTAQVAGFKKLRWLTRENLGEEPLDLPPTELQTTGYWLSLSDAAIETLRTSGAWTNDPNDYGPDWPRIRLAVRTRDGFRCQVCGAAEGGREHDVHHKIPFQGIYIRHRSESTRQSHHALFILSSQSRTECPHSFRLGGIILCVESVSSVILDV